MRTISVRLDDLTDMAVLALCERHGYSQAEALKEAIGQMAARSRPTPGQLARELGLVGSFRSGARELAQQHASRSKEHLQARKLVQQEPAGAGSLSRAPLGKPG